MMKGRLIMALLLWMAVANNVWGETVYWASVVCDRGMGYVYASTEEEPLSIDEISGWDERCDLWSMVDDPNEENKPAEGTPYWVYAKPADGFLFLGWKWRNGWAYEVSEEYISLEPIHKMAFHEDDLDVYAVFKEIPKLVGVPRAFTVYVDNVKVDPNESGDYQILNGKTVKISWSNDYQCGFSSEIPSANNATFTMTENDVSVVLNSLTISSGVTQIAEKAFYNCGLTDVYYEGTKAQWDAVEKGEGAFTYSIYDEEEGEDIEVPSTIHWRCTATFNMMGHGTAPTAQNFYIGVANALTKPATDPTAEGYDFGGWFADVACNTPFDFTAALSDNVTVYAKWYQKVSITFDAQGGEVSPASMTTDNGKLTSLPTPVKDGWIFKGWYTEPTGGSLVTTSTEFSTNTTVYAQWYQESSYALNLSTVTITPYEDQTPFTVSVSGLKMCEDRDGKTPKCLRVILNAGTLTNQTDNSKTIPFQLNMGSGGLGNQVQGDFAAGGSNNFNINISSDNWNSAMSGTYSGTISYKAIWIYTDNTVSDNLETGTINVSTTIPESYAITITASPAEGGTLTGGGTYDEGTDVTLTATANEGYRFVNWTEDGNEVSTEDTYIFTVSADRSLVANFEQGYTITVAADPEEGGTVTGGSSGFYADGMQFVFAEIPNEGYRFKNWTIDGIDAGSETTYPFTVDGDFSTVVAHFERVYPLSGTNVFFFPEGSINSITEAAEGERVTVSLYPVNVQDGYYLTGEFSTDGVVITKEEDNEDGWFIMPAKAVTVNAVTARRTEYEIDLTAATVQTITREAWLAVMQQKGYFSIDCDETDCVQYLDLNLDGTPDLQLTDDYNEATRVTTYGVTKLDGANQLTTNYRLTIPTFPELNPSPYSTILVTLGSGSEVNNLPEIIMGDVNGDGRVTITDATLLTDFVNTGVEPAGFVKAAADVDYSRSITMADVMAILEIILTSFPTID